MKCNLLHHYWTTTIDKAFTQKGTRPLHSGCTRHRYIPIFQWDSRRLRDHRIHCIRTTPDAAAGQESSTRRLHRPPTYDMTSRPRAGDDVKYNCWTKTESEPDAREPAASCHVLWTVYVCLSDQVQYTYNMRMNE